MRVPLSKKATDVFNLFRAKKAVSNIGCRVFDSRELSKFKDKTCFILGSGKTVNELTDNQWEIINENFSIGINKWLINDFIPDVISLEKNHFKGFYETILSDNRLKNSKLKFIFYPLHGYLIEKKFPYTLPAELNSKIRLFISHSAQIKKYSDLIELLHSRGLINGFIDGAQKGFVYELNGSVFRLVNLAVASGFKKIVFIGVDLNSGIDSYFWSNKPELLKKRNVTSDMFHLGNFSVHPTEDGSNDKLLMTEVIRVLSEQLHKIDVEFMVSSKNSKLSGFLPIWEK